jgi:hypothetical protein
MKLFGVVGEENNKSTREKMPKYDYYEIEAKKNGEGGDENLNIKFIWPK